MTPVYDKASNLPVLGQSDHRMVLYKPTETPTLNTGSVSRITTRCTRQNASTTRYTSQNARTTRYTSQNARTTRYTSQNARTTRYTSQNARTTRYTSQNARTIFARSRNLQCRWEPLNRLETYEEQNAIYLNVMDDLIQHSFPLKSVTRHSADKPRVTDNVRSLIRKRKRARMSGDIEAAHVYRNMVNRAAPRLRHILYQHILYQSKVFSLQDSSSKNWWKNMKSWMGLKPNRKSELQGLANIHTAGDIESLAKTINDILSSVSKDLPRLSSEHPIFQMNEPYRQIYYKCR